MADKIFHNLTISVFIKEEDDYSIVKESLLKLFPFDIKDAKVGINENSVSIVEDRTMSVVDICLTRNRQINDTIKHLWSMMTKEDNEMILNQIDSRVDDESNFYFRIDRDLFIKNNELKIFDGGKCFHVKCLVATYPQNSEKAKEIIIEFLNDYVQSLEK